MAVSFSLQFFHVAVILLKGANTNWKSFLSSVSIKSMFSGSASGSVALM